MLTYDTIYLVWKYPPNEGLDKLAHNIFSSPCLHGDTHRYPSIFLLGLQGSWRCFVSSEARGINAKMADGPLAICQTTLGSL